MVRKIATTLYHDAPVNEPGNDDLGAISSWYVWAAIGLYPVTPGTANLALASPLFPEVSLELAGGHTLVLSAPDASAGTPYVHSLTVGGHATSDPWLPASVLSSGASLDFVLSGSPDKTWGDQPADAPPSYAAGRLPGLGYSLPGGSVTVVAGRQATIQLGLDKLSAGSPGATWTATATAGLTIRPSSGVLGGTAPLLQVLDLDARSQGHAQIDVALRSTTGVALPPVVVDVNMKGSG